MIRNKQKWLPVAVSEVTFYSNIPGSKRENIPLVVTELHRQGVYDSYYTDS